MREYKIVSDRVPGGQSCGMISSTFVVTDKDLGIEIKCNYFKSQHKNREFIEELFKIAEEKLKDK